MEFNKDEFNWTQKPVVGTALLLQGGSIDSHGKKIENHIFYEVGKHKETGKVVIFPTERRQDHEFVKDIMKRSGQLN